MILNEKRKEIVIAGYGGHGFVAAEMLVMSGYTLAGYCDDVKKTLNPFKISYLGKEIAFFSQKENKEIYAAFIAIGNPVIRKKVFNMLSEVGVQIVNAIHTKAVVSDLTHLGKGIFIAAGAIINPCCSIGDGVICNTNSSIDHECTIGAFSHICPGTVLCGNVNIGESCFIGANSIIIPGKKIGNNITIGAGSTVIDDFSSPGIYIGNPAKLHKAF